MTGEARSSQPALILVGDPKVGLGTAWVVSRKARLLATNAHVADIMAKAGGTMIGIRNGTAEIYSIDHAWYHPGVLRVINNGLSVRSQDTSTGSVNPLSPDVAVLHVADGPDLPAELAMATSQEVADCFAQSVGMMGFPGHDTSHWPALGEKAVATFREGVISRLTDFHNDASRPDAELQYLQHSMTSWFGFSGSPIFLSNGHVVALNNSARAMKQGEHQIELAYGIRIDCLWELLAFHGLDSQVPLPKPKSELLIDRYNRPDPLQEKLYKAKLLVNEASISVTAQNYTDAGEKLNQAIELAPNYAAAYEERARMYMAYKNQYGDSVGQYQGQTQLYYGRLALADNKKALQLNPTDNLSYINTCNAMLGVALAQNGQLGR